MTVPEFKISTTSGDGSLRVAVAGELDVATLPALTRSLQAQRDAGRNTVLDLSGLDFIDTSGIGTVLQAVKDSRASEWRLTIHLPVASPVRRTFEISGLIDLLPLADA